MENIMKNMYMSIIILAMMLIIIPLSSSASNNETTNISNAITITYRSYVDQDYGFYRVIDYTTHKPALYEEKTKTLTINVGDTVEWINDATPDEPLTIISKDGLWGNRSAYLRWNYQKFNYTFNQSGTYDIYIREYPTEQHQTIVVIDISETIKIISTPTIISTTSPIINKTENAEDNLSNISTTNKSKVAYKNGVIPIEAIVAVVGIIILIAYINRSGKKKC